MHVNINGTNVPAEIVRGLGHQIVREYAAGDLDGCSWPAGQTTQGLPWFRSFMEAVSYLEDKPYAGYIQSYVLTEDGARLSNITAGAYYRKVAGDRLGPIALIELRLEPTEANAAQLRRLFFRVGGMQLLGKLSEPGTCICHLQVSDFAACIDDLTLGQDEQRAREVLAKAQAYDLRSIRLTIVENSWWEACR